MLPAIVVIAYNRPDNLKRLLTAIEKAKYPNGEIRLIISIDFCQGNDEVIKVAENMKWEYGEKIVKTHEKNLGLRKHVIECADLSMDYGAAIIFEDDVYPSPYFYLYTCQALEFYKDNKNIFAISLYSQEWNGYANRQFIPANNGYDAYLSKIECSWGECFIGDRWREFKDWYCEHEDNLTYSYDVPDVVYYWKKSYSKYLLYYVVEKNLYYVTPFESFSTNFHSMGTHSARTSSVFQTRLAMGTRDYKFPSMEDAVYYDAFMESVGLKSYLEKCYSAKVAVDYFGIRKNHCEYDYVLSSVLLPFEKEKMYALQLKPYEMNVYENIAGETLFLYNTKKEKKIKRDWTHHYNWLNYEIKDLSWQDALFWFIYNKFVKK